MALNSKNNFVFKFMFVAGFIWFAFVIMVILPGSQLNFSEKDYIFARTYDSSFPHSDQEKSANWHQPIIERLDIDRLRFEEARKEDAAAQLREKEQQRKEKLINEEISRRRALDRLMPPFKPAEKSTTSPAQLNVSKEKSSTSVIDNLIKSGLIVPRWGNQVETPIDPRAQGENGVDVNINKNDLSPEERKKFDDGWQRNAFNQYASDLISLHRSLPDVRDAECRPIKYSENLPDTSVIIIFHNEAWSALLRTVHSVLDRSPPHLVKEVILVDDYSDLSHLRKPLEEYVAKLQKVYVVRAKSRQGLIRARLLGASRATGQVLTFLDSHCECARGWLEPLLDRIAQNKSNVVTPIIDVLDDSTLRYQHSSARFTNVGGFDWNLQFNWHGIPAHERARRKSIVEPLRSPTMAGGLFSIDKSYFEYLGTYDPGMDIWGGENLELSFRTWMCGGSLEIIICSHVGHIFRSHSPYKWRKGVNILKMNTIRVAEVWLDEYKKYYYERVNFELGDYGDVTSRKELRKQLKCKSFNWYLTNIYPELFVPGDSMASGEIRNKVAGTFSGARHIVCLDSAADKNALSKPVNLWPCHNMGGNQYWMLSKNGEIRRDDICMDAIGDSVIMMLCHGQRGNQEWEYTSSNSLFQKNIKKCLELSADGLRLEMKHCTGIDRQVWLWKRMTAHNSSLSALHGA